jgi:hypothetical protein
MFEVANVLQDVINVLCCAVLHQAEHDYSFYDTITTAEVMWCGRRYSRKHVDIDA